MAERSDMERRTSREWLEIYQQEHPGFDIYDPDGWDRSPGNFRASWEERITREEFSRRVMLSTCRYPTSMLNVALAADQPGED